ncbi:transcriptional regulator EpsA [compost metagenome]
MLHAVSAGEPGAAASLVEGCALALLARGELNRVASLVRMLPEEEVRQRYPLHVVMAYMQLYARDFDALRASLDLLEAQRDALGANGRYSLCLLKAGLALQCDENDEAAALQDEIWDAPPDADEFAWHARANVLSWFLTQRGEHDLVRCVLEEADQRTRSRRSWLLGRCIHALSLARQGQIQQAGKIVREVLEEAECLGPGYVPVASMAAGLLADTLYELNETEAACQLLEPRIGMLERASLPEVVLRASVVLSNSHWLAGRRELALACLDRLEAYASRYALDRLLAEAMVLRLRRHLQRGQMEQAGFALERVEALALRHAGSGPEKSVQIARAAARAWIEMALYTRNFAGAQERIESLIAAGDQSPGAASLHMQLAIARLGLGAAQAARLDFIEAIGVGHRLGLSRTLLDAQEIVPDAIDALAREPLPDPVLEFYVQRLAQAHRSAARGHGHGDAGPEVDAIAMLSEREREILQLLAQAMSNKKIARILNVSAETVKWHLKNIYAKLGVGGRGGAAALLRDLIGPGQR